MAWGFGENSNKADNVNTAPPVVPEAGSPEALAAAMETPQSGAESTQGNEGGGTLDLTDAPRKRGRPRKTAATVPEAGKMDALFSEKGVGVLWVNGWNAFFNFCGANKLTPEEEKQQASVFAYWCKARLPETPEKYQPDILLAATLLMSLVPRIAPIAEKTSPWWKRMFNKLRGKREEPNDSGE